VSTSFAARFDVGLTPNANRPSSHPGQGGAVVADMVYRRLGTPVDFWRACRLLGAGGSRPADEIWSGLWNLTADDGDALAAVAATRQISPRVVEVRAIRTNHGYAVQARLLRELADASRANGVEWLVAVAGGAGTEMFCRAGFAPATNLDLPQTRTGWLALQV